MKLSFVVTLFCCVGFVWKNYPELKIDNACRLAIKLGCFSFSVNLEILKINYTYHKVKINR